MFRRYILKQSYVVGVCLKRCGVVLDSKRVFVFGVNGKGAKWTGFIPNGFEALVSFLNPGGFPVLLQSLSLIGVIVCVVVMFVDESLLLLLVVFA